MSPAQHLYQSLPPLPKHGGEVFPVEEAGPGVSLEPHGAPEVGGPEQGERGEASDWLEEAVEEEEEEGWVEVVHHSLGITSCSLVQCSLLSLYAK